MFKMLYLYPIRFPRVAILTVLIVTVLALSQLSKLEWETDARVYFPKGHPAIEYDELVADVFGVKDSIVIGIVNEKGIFNTETLARVKRISDKLAQLPGVLTQRRQDIVSLSTASVFVGTSDEIANVALIDTVPQTAAGLQALRDTVFDNADMFVGNLVSADGKATMIRAKLKEGKEYRYQSYFQVKGILAAELGGGKPSGAWGGGWSGNSNWSDKGGWQSSGADNENKADAGDTAADADKEEAQDGQSQQWGNKNWQSGGGWPQVISSQQAKNGDRFYIAGRPVIEVTSGLNAMDDMKLMIPLLVLAIAVALFLMFRSLRGVMLPLLVVSISIVWTLGFMAAVGVPLYTISTMLPVILVAVGIGDGIHLMSHYEDIVLENPHDDRRNIVARLMKELGMPLFITTLTTAVGFMSLWWAEMPPFRVFGVFTAIGITFCWLVSISLVPAMLSLMQPHISGYLKRRRSARVHDESSLLTRGLVGLASAIINNRKSASVIMAVVVIVSALGMRHLYVDSSWLSDFTDDSEVVMATDMLNKKFDGTIFLNVVVDGKHPDALKSPKLLQRIDRLQTYVEGLDDVGGSLSLVDYLKSTNKTFHAGDEAYDVIPASERDISEYLFLLSVSGRPEQLDTVVDFDYSQANITFMIRTDHTQRLKSIIHHVNQFVDNEFKGMDVKVNLAGSANNSYIWADLLINSQVMAILLSKLGIFLVAALLFRSLLAGLYTILPVSLTTLIVGGVAGFAGIPLDVSTVLAAGVAIGVGVDYAVHYIFRYHYQRNSDLAQADASLAAVRSVGKAIVLNAVVVTVGFLVLGMSQFPPHVKLGYFVSAYMVVACLSALTVLPLAYAWLQPRSRQTS